MIHDFGNHFVGTVTLELDFEGGLPDAPVWLGLRVAEIARELEELVRYWGAMADAGADTFRELFDPVDPEASPYGGTIINSYCHAWSCAPAYFLRKVFSVK